MALKLPPNILPKTDETEIINCNYILDEKKRFVDITHNGLGRICKVYHNSRTKKYEFEPV